ncbi:Ff.00g020900.m01.CDS01 [Fusarium sp. VM40]|nr:Ff.00g020900.m01.CDS01 [Fusarium sp. VM40]
MSQHIKTIPTSEYLSVVAVAENYIVGLKTGDVAQVARSFHSDATIHGFGADGSLLSGPISALYSFMETFGASPNIVARSDVTSITSTTAAVKVDIEGDVAGNDFTDNLTLLKLDGKWVIIVKVFHCYTK